MSNVSGPGQLYWKFAEFTLLPLQTMLWFGCIGVVKRNTIGEPTGTSVAPSAGFAKSRPGPPVLPPAVVLIANCVCFAKDTLPTAPGYAVASVPAFLVKVTIPL